MRLSILICHTIERDTQLMNILAGAMQQLNFPTAYICDVVRASSRESEVIARDPDLGVEIVIVSDNKTKMTIGQKRNRLLKIATGEWCASVDDDDLIAENYFERVLNALKESPDCIGIEGLLKRSGFPDERFVHSKRFDHWYTEDGIHLRCPNHLNPVRRELALQAGFPDDSNHGEDHAFSMKLLPLLKTEVMLEGDPVYFYFP